MGEFLLNEFVTQLIASDFLDRVWHNTHDLFCSISAAYSEHWEA
jgi:hypothetical protein